MKKLLMMCLLGVMVISGVIYTSSLSDLSGAAEHEYPDANKEVK